MSEDKPGVLDPQWEDALRAGQSAEGERGTVEAELAVIHLLRHARGAEPLGPDAMDQIWSELEPEIAAVPWWRRVLDWRVGVGVAVAAAAAAVLVVAAQPSAPEGSEATVAQAGSGSDAAAMGITLQAQFDMLAPSARDDITGRVDDGRSRVRGRLLATITGSSQADRPATIGGAP